jgi:hypothetical protein
MIPPIVVLIATVALSAIALIILLVCVLKNMLRPVLRSGMQLVVALACIPIALLVTKLACQTALSKVLGMIDLAVLQQILTDLPSGQEAIEGLAQIVVAPFVFTLIYFFLWIIIGAIVGSVVRSLERGGSKVATYKHKAIGAAIGAVSAVVLVVVYLMPLIGFTGMVPEVMDVLCGVELSEGEPLLEIGDEDTASINKIVNTPALSIPRALGGKALFRAASTTRLDGEKLSLTGEIGMITKLAATVLPIAEKGIDNIDEADVAVLQQELPEAFENSALLRVLGSEALSGFSHAWLKGEAFLTVEKPEMEGMTAIVVDSALVLFKDTTKDTIVSDIRGLTPALSAALAVTKLQSGGDLSDIMDVLADCADSPEIKSLVMSAGVGILADKLGLYGDKQEIYDSYAEALAALSSSALTEEQLRTELVALNDKYAVSMTDEEVAALARSLAAHPYGASSKPVATAPAQGYPVVAPCGLFQPAPKVQLVMEIGEDISDWMARIAEEAAKDQESLAWLDKKEEIPTSLVTTKDLTALTTREALADLGKEEMTALISAAAELVSGEGEIKLEDAIGVVGDALSGFAATESGKALVTNLVTGVLQSETVCENMGITPGQATTIANAIKDSGSLENLGETAKDISNLMGVLGHLKDDSSSAGESVSPEDFHTLISTMNDSSAELLRSLCTPDMLGKMGLPAESTVGIAHLLDDLLDGLIVARKNWSDEAYQKEADALYRVLQLAVGAKNGSGSTFEERFGMSPEQFIETVQASELLTTVLPGSIDELYAENPDALGLSGRLDADDREALLAEIDKYKQTADEGGDALLDALARMLG